MKQALLSCFIGLLCLGQTLYAQHPYIPVPEDSTFWISVHEDWDEAGDGQHGFNYLIWYADGKDTIVNGIRYFCYFGDLPPLSHYGNWSAIFGYWFRQDTIEKKIWMVSDESGPYEDLLYDFSLHTGDTLSDTTQFYFYICRPYKFWVDHIDSVYFPDNTWRYRWFIESNYGPDWGRPPAEVIQIEGMGYTTDFEQSPMAAFTTSPGHTYQITCFRHNSLWLYERPNPWNADCDTLMDHNVAAVGINEPVSELNLPLLYPNPAASGGKIYLNSYAGKSGVPHTVTAYSLDGQQVLHKLVQPGQSFTLPYLPPGLYFFSVCNDKAQIISKQKIRIR